ncbi:MAG TPA: BamA/TamA family outer membrane protein, partial [Vicinamibacterales bacterium]|nr:BamA/TamA family outer membrane protein [Vicinamibacterales bacterium]
QFAITGRFGWLHRPSLGDPGGTFKRSYPTTASLFPDEPAFTEQQPNYLHGETAFTLDTRNSRSHPVRGGVYRAAWSMYSDRDAGAYSFRRYEAEGEHFLPTMNERLVFAAHGWFVGTETGPNETVPIYMLPSLGGPTTLRGYSSFRFHDRNLLVMNIEARLAVLTHVDAAAFLDAGNVAARVADLDLAKRSYGVGLRLHTDRATFGRLDIAHSVEGWKFVLQTNDPLHLARLSRRLAAIPFAP